MPSWRLRLWQKWSWHQFREGLRLAPPMTPSLASLEPSILQTPSLLTVSGYSYKTHSFKDPNL